MMKSKKSFRAYFWEFLILFVAVFMGFLAENFRENLSERKKERTLIHSLLSDLNTDAERISLLIKENELKVERMLEFTGIRELDFGIDSNRVHFMTKLMPIYLWSVYTFEPSRASLNQLQSTGMMSSLKASIAQEISLYAVILEQIEIGNQVIIDRTGVAYTMVYDMTDHISMYEDPTRIKPFVVDQVFMMRFFNRVADLTYILESYLDNLRVVQERIMELIATIEEEYDLSAEDQKMIGSES